MIKLRVFSYPVFLILLITLCLSPLCYASDEVVNIEVDAPTLGFDDLYPGNSFNVEVMASNVSYVNRFGIDKVAVRFNFEVYSHNVRLLDGNIDSTIKQTQYYGWGTNKVELGKASLFEVTLRDDVEFSSNHWYEVCFNFKVSELIPSGRDYSIGETLVEKSVSYKVFGDDYIDYVYTLISGLNASEIEYTQQLGIPLIDILEQGSAIDLTEIAADEGYGYAWASRKPVIEGVMGANEWKDAYHYSDGMNHLYLKNDETDLYFLFSVRDKLDEGDALVLRFDNNADGGADRWDDALRVNCDESGVLDLYLDHELYNDLDEGGSCDGEGAYGYDGENIVFEISHPLNSGDKYDVSFMPLDLFGLGITYINNGTESFYLPELYGGRVVAQMLRVMVASKPESNRLRTSISFDVEPSIPVMGQVAQVSGLLDPSNGGEDITLSFRINLVPIETLKVTTDEDGAFTAQYIFKESGVWNVKAEFSGSNELYGCSSDKNIQVCKDTRENGGLQNTTIMLDAIYVDVNDSMKLRIDGFLLPYPVNEPVNILVNGSEVTVYTDAVGRFTLTYDIVQTGRYNVTACYLGSDVYKGSREQAWVLAEKIQDKETEEIGVLKVIYGLGNEHVIALFVASAAVGYLVWKRR